MGVEDVLGPPHGYDAGADHFDDPEGLQEICQPIDLGLFAGDLDQDGLEGHIDDAIMIDFYSDDFADQLAGLDPDVPYVLYCRSGNRSGQTLAIMEQLGFTSVQDVDGGALAWQEDGLPLVPG